jgi:hypothetical protein
MLPVNGGYKDEVVAALAMAARVRFPLRSKGFLTFSLERPDGRWQLRLLPGAGLGLNGSQLTSVFHPNLPSRRTSLRTFTACGRLRRGGYADERF